MARKGLLLGASARRRQSGTVWRRRSDVACRSRRRDGSAVNSRFCAGLPDFEDDKFERFPVEVSLDPPLCKNTADLLHGFLRPDVIGSDQKNYVIDKLEGVVQ